MNRSLLFFLFCLFVSTHSTAQFRALNLAMLPSSENASFIVSPADYNKISLYGSGLGQRSFMAQKNIDKYYSAIGTQVTRYSPNAYAVALRGATHTLMTSKNFHVGIGAELEMFSGLSKDAAWGAGVHLMSNPPGKFAVGFSMKSFEYAFQPFESNVHKQVDVRAVQMGYGFPLTRKWSIGQSLNWKSFLNQSKREQVVQYGLTLTSRKYAVGVGVRKYDEVHFAEFVRLGVYYKRLMFGYVGFFDKQHFAFKNWTNELTLVFKL